MILANPSLQHPNIVQLLYQTVLNDGQFALVLELHSRGSLESFLQERSLSRTEFALLAETAAGGK